MGPFTNKKILRKFAVATTQIASELVSSWKASSPTGVLQADIAEHMQRLTLDVIGNVSFSYNFGGMDHVRRELAGTAGKDSGKDKLMGYVNTWTEQVGKLAAPWITSDVLEVGTKLGDPRCTKLKNSIEGMRSMLLEIIEERRQRIREGAADMPEDLMTELINIQEEQGKDAFTDTELWEDIHDVMGAGHETTANTLTTALWEVSMHPEVGAQLHAELDALLGVGKDRRLPTFEDYEEGKLPYTTQVVKETLRLYPPIPLFVRETAKTDILPGGYEIQEGDTVFMSAYALGRTERFWENAYKFDPDRFTPELEAKRGQWTFLPFGAGPRMCMGTRFALMSTVLQLATIVQSYSFSPVRPNYRTESQSDIPYIGAWRGGMPIEYDMTIAFPEGCTLEATPHD
jgi:cytochrome P450